MKQSASEASRNFFISYFLVVHGVVSKNFFVMSPLAVEAWFGGVVLSIDRTTP